MTGGMMTVAKIERIAYIGWRGISGCEVLELDEQFTALLGAAGAGKSTLITCLNYAILPDRRALNIRPVSDVQAAQNAGIDPLAEKICPQYGYAYVVLDITTRSRQRLIAGIYVELEDERATLKPWLIQKPSEDSSIHELMCCADGDEVYFPAFTELKRELSSKGIDVNTCKTVGEYCQALYDAGILPSSMNSTTDRTLYANLIEATFRGGISPEITAQLKDYLLPPQTQVQELVGGLQECTNELMRTRNAIGDANRELKLLESTYGTGRQVVLTALRCISDDIFNTDVRIDELKGRISDMESTKTSLSEMIPALKQEITQSEDTRKNVLADNLTILRNLDSEKQALSEELASRRMDWTNAAGGLKNLEQGRELWSQVVDPGALQQSADEAEQWLDSESERVRQEAYGVTNRIKELESEHNGLSSDVASTASEQLASLVGGQPLSLALRHLSHKDAIVHDMSLGGLTEGLVGAQPSTLANVAPSKALPELFWLGKTLPEVSEVKEIGQWYVMPYAGGHVVASKDKRPAFGQEGRNQRRKDIAEEIACLRKELDIRSKNAAELNRRKRILLTNHGVIQYYLDNRHDEVAIEKRAKEAEKAFLAVEKTLSDINQKRSSIQDRITTIQEPYDEAIRVLTGKLISKESDLKRLNSEISDHQDRLRELRSYLTTHQNEMDCSKEILGSDYPKFMDCCKTLILPVRHLMSEQSRRIAELENAIGSEAATLDSFREVRAEDRLSVVRLWPDLVRIVYESVSTDLADADGADLILAMKEKRERLGEDLATWESELGVKAKNIHMSIGGSVRSQQLRIGKLSKLGQNIEFGNVTGIRIRLVPRSKMIDILQQFGDQLTLFSNSLPIDQVLKEFFDVAMAGGVRLSGEQLLDYRSYVDLLIEVKRKSQDWELASSLSGTESIGGGLAIALMLIRSLGARGESSSGVKVEDIRPLFAVDEASRLDPIGQQLLVEFAKREKFQLVVTAPSLTPSYNSKFYALHRQFDPERLIIRGIKYRPAVEGLA